MTTLCVICSVFPIQFSAHTVYVQIFRDVIFAVLRLTRYALLESIDHDKTFITTIVH